MGVLQDSAISHRTKFCVDLISSKDIHNKTILDVGCSDTLWVSKYLVKNQAKLCVGIDPFLAEESDSENIISYKADIFDARIGKENLYDTAVMFDVIEHTPPNTENQTLERIHSLLKKGGSLYLTTPNDRLLMNIVDPAWYVGHRHYKLSWLISKFEEAGFDVIKSGTTGGAFESIRVLWLYIQKHLLRKSKFSYPKWLWNAAQFEFEKSGIMTNFIIGRKK